MLVLPKLILYGTVFWVKWHWLITANRENYMYSQSVIRWNYLTFFNLTKQYSSYTNIKALVLFRYIKLCAPVLPGSDLGNIRRYPAGRVFCRGGTSVAVVWLVFVGGSLWFSETLATVLFSVSIFFSDRVVFSSSWGLIEFGSDFTAGWIVWELVSCWTVNFQ